MTSTEQVRRKYDEIADHYEDIFFYVADIGKQLVDYADPVAGARMLDVGAGRGAVVRAGLARGCAVTATDASRRMAEWLAADFPEITARQLDVGRLDFPDGSFDLVTAGFLVQVLDDPAAAMAEIRRVLAPAGLFAMSLETQSIGRLQWLQELQAEFFPAPPEDTAPEGTPAEGTPAEDIPADPDPGPPLAQDVDTLLAEAGFVDLDCRPVQMPMPLADPAALWEWLGPRGLQDALAALPDERAAEFRSRFLSGAAHMHTHGGIMLEFAATLHRARVPG